MSGPARIAGRIGIHVVITVALTFAVAWLVEEVPVLAVVVGALSIALLGWTVLRVLRRPPSLAALGFMGVTILAGWLVSVAAVALLGDEAEAVDVAAEGSTTSSTSSTSEPDGASGDTSSTPEPAGGPGEVRSVEVDEDGGTTTLTVTSDGRPMSVWAFSTATPAQPIVFEWRDGWTQVGGPAAAISEGDDELSIEVDAPSDAGWAVVDDRGNRAPAAGHVDADGVIFESRDAGANADRIAERLVTIQRAVPQLEPDVAAFVLALVGRQLTPGTFVVDRTLAGNDAATAQQLAFVAQWPRFTQHLLPDRVFGVWALPDEIVSCNGERCESMDVLLPVASAAAIVADPGALELAPAEPGEYEGTPTTCVDVVAVPAGGPSIGRTCWLPDGRPTLLDRTEAGDRLTLRSVSSDVDPAHLEPPR